MTEEVKVIEKEFQTLSKRVETMNEVKEEKSFFSSLWSGIKDVAKKCAKGFAGFAKESASRIKRNFTTVKGFTNAGACALAMVAADILLTGGAFSIGAALFGFVGEAVIEPVVKSGLKYTAKTVKKIFSSDKGKEYLVSTPVKKQKEKQQVASGGHMRQELERQKARENMTQGMGA